MWKVKWTEKYSRTYDYRASAVNKKQKVGGTIKVVPNRHDKRIQGHMKIYRARRWVPGHWQYYWAKRWHPGHWHYYTARRWIPGYWVRYRARRWISGYWYYYWARKWIPAHWQSGKDYKVTWTEPKSKICSSASEASFIMREKKEKNPNVSWFEKKTDEKVVAGYKVSMLVKKIKHCKKYVSSYSFDGWNPSEDESEILMTPKNNYQGAWTIEATDDPDIKVAIREGFLKVKPNSRRGSLHSGEVRVTPIDKPSWIGEWHEDRTYAVGLSGSKPSPKYSSDSCITTELPEPPTQSEPTPPNKGKLVVKAVEKGNESHVIDDATITVTQGKGEIFTAEGSGSKDLPPGQYSVTFEYKTLSGWTVRVENSPDQCDPQPGRFRTGLWEVKAGETKTVKGYYEKKDENTQVQDFNIIAPDSIPVHWADEPHEGIWVELNAIYDAFARVDGSYAGHASISIERINYSDDITFYVSGHAFNANICGKYTTVGIIVTHDTAIKLVVGFDRGTGTGPPEVGWNNMYVTLDAMGGDGTVKEKKIYLETQI